MATSPRQQVEKQVRRVRRRLMLHHLSHALLITWAVALVASALWFLGTSLFYKDCPDALRWGPPGAALVVATLAALISTWLTAPTFVSSSLALDECCELQERITTYLTLPTELQAKPAAQALEQDVHDQVARLNLAGKFPMPWNWRTALMPAVAACLAVTAALFAPSIGPFNLARIAKAKPAIDAKEIQQQLDNLRKTTFTPKDAELKSEKLKELEAEWEKLVNKPLDPNNEDKIRERVGEMKALEENLRKRADELKSQTGKNKDFHQLLKQLGLEADKQLQPGPAKDLEDALASQDMQKVRDILDKLAKDLKAGKLDPEQLKKMAEEFGKLQEKMKRALDRDDIKKKLDDKLKKGEITKEQFDREMNNLKEQAQDMKDLQDLADLIGDCKACMEKGDADNAADEVGKALDKVKMIELTDDELKEILDRLENLENAEAEIIGQLQGNGLDGGGPPGAERPIDPDDPKGKIVDQKQKAHVDPKGQQRVTGFAKGGNFTKMPVGEIGGAFKQAAQDAPEALDRQRIPQDAADLARGYFKKLGGQ